MLGRRFQPNDVAVQLRCLRRASSTGLAHAMAPAAAKFSHRIFPASERGMGRSPAKFCVRELACHRFSMTAWSVEAHASKACSDSRSLIVRSLATFTRGLVGTRSATRHLTQFIVV